jgi:uncharacterized membrane protein YdcZ (DUF606 family)
MPFFIEINGLINSANVFLKESIRDALGKSRQIIIAIAGHVLIAGVIDTIQGVAVG